VELFLIGSKNGALSIPGRLSCRLIDDTQGIVKTRLGDVRAPLKRLLTVFNPFLHETHAL
jgi:hypothetical protein